MPGQSAVVDSAAAADTTDTTLKPLTDSMRRLESLRSLSLRPTPQPHSGWTRISVSGFSAVSLVSAALFLVAPYPKFPEDRGRCHGTSLASHSGRISRPIRALERRRPVGATPAPCGR